MFSIVDTILKDLNTNSEEGRANVALLRSARLENLNKLVSLDNAAIGKKQEAITKLVVVHHEMVSIEAEIVIYKSEIENFIRSLIL